VKADLLHIDEEFMNITWRISFSGRSPGKLLFGDMFNWAYRVDHNDTQYDKMVKHDTVELLS
jgi:hypothetical protein